MEKHARSLFGLSLVVVATVALGLPRSARADKYGSFDCASFPPGNWQLRSSVAKSDPTFMSDGAQVSIHIVNGGDAKQLVVSGFPANFKSIQGEGDFAAAGGAAAGFVQIRQLGSNWIARAAMVCASGSRCVLIIAPSADRRPS